MAKILYVQFDGNYLLSGVLHLTMACVSVKDGICIDMHCIINQPCNMVWTTFPIYDKCIKATYR